MVQTHGTALGAFMLGYRLMVNKILETLTGTYYQNQNVDAQQNSYLSTFFSTSHLHLQLLYVTHSGHMANEVTKTLFPAQDERTLSQ